MWRYHGRQGHRQCSRKQSMENLQHGEHPVKPLGGHVLGHRDLGLREKVNSQS